MPHNDILSFWFGDWTDDTPIPDPCPELKRWWQKDPVVDAHISSTWSGFLSQDLSSWERSPQGALAKVLVLDQGSRVIHRGSGRSFENDAEARATLTRAIAAGFDAQLSPIQRYFLTMPLMHSEQLSDHDDAVPRFEALVEATRHTPRASNYANALKYQHMHRDIIVRFGRYPHRNALLGRSSTAEEEVFLSQPGSSF